MEAPKAKRPPKRGALRTVSRHAGELEDDLRAELDDPGVDTRRLCGQVTSEVSRVGVGVHTLLGRTLTGELSVVPDVEELKAQLQLRPFAVKICDLPESEVPVVDPGAVEKVTARVAHCPQVFAAEGVGVEIIEVLNPTRRTRAAQAVVRSGRPDVVGCH